MNWITTKMPDAHWLTEARMQGTRIVVIADGDSEDAAALLGGTAPMHTAVGIVASNQQRTQRNGKDIGAVAPEAHAVDTVSTGPRHPRWRASVRPGLS